MNDTQLAFYVAGSSIIIMGIAFLLHIAKSPRDAHGRNRK